MRLTVKSLLAACLITLQMTSILAAPINTGDSSQTIIQRQYRNGETVYAKIKNRWFRARVIEALPKESRWQVQLSKQQGAAAYWLQPAELRPIDLPPDTSFPAQHSLPLNIKVGDHVFAAWLNEWHPAEVIAINEGKYQVHFLGYDSYWNEWATPSRIEPYEKDNKGDEVLSPQNQRLFEAIANRDNQQVRQLLTTKVDVNALDQEGLSPLQLAAKTGNMEIVQELLQAGAAINQVDNYGQTALLWAASNAHWSVVKELLRQKADPNVGQSAMFYVIRYGQLELLETLIEQKADLNKEIIPGLTPLQLAHNFHQKRMVKMLVEAGAKP